jgi:hypothetical protein
LMLRSSSFGPCWSGGVGQCRQDRRTAWVVRALPSSDEDVEDAA